MCHHQSVQSLQVTKIRTPLTMSTGMGMWVAGYKALRDAKVLVGIVVDLFAVGEEAAKDSKEEGVCSVAMHIEEWHNCACCFQVNHQGGKSHIKYTICNAYMDINHQSELVMQLSMGHKTCLSCTISLRLMFSVA